MSEGWVVWIVGVALVVAFGLTELAVRRIKRRRQAELEDLVQPKMKIVPLELPSERHKAPRRPRNEPPNAAK